MSTTNARKLASGIQKELLDDHSGLNHGRFHKLAESILEMADHVDSLEVKIAELENKIDSIRDR